MNHDSSQTLEEARRLDRAGDRERAVEAYRGFLQRSPRTPGAWADLGGLLLVMGRLKEAELACRAALALDQSHQTGRINLASTLLAQGQPGSAEELIRTVVTQAPKDVPSRMCLADCLMQRGALAEARSTLDGALALGPENRELHQRRADLALMASDWATLRREMEWMLAKYTGPAQEYERGHIALLLGQLPQGWDHYEARLGVPGLIQPERHFPEPRWSGEPFPGQTLLLHWEQGFGDTLTYIRYASRAKALGGKVLVEVQRPLADLVATCPGVDQVVAYGDPLPPFDLQVSLVSLPQVFRTTLDTIPADIPYLDVPDRVPNQGALAQKIAQGAGRVKIGLVWAGNPIFRKDRTRSMAPEALAPLAQLAGVSWFSFQVREDAVPPLPGLTSLGPLLSHFGDTAYALSGMDLVISVDTAVAHLAGALGIPTLVLLPFHPDFRWLLGRTESPWYRSLRLYRQPRPHTWEPVISEVLRDLS